MILVALEFLSEREGQKRTLGIPGGGEGFIFHKVKLNSLLTMLRLGLAKKGKLKTFSLLK